MSVELSGVDHVLDVIAESEAPPAFPGLSEAGGDDGDQRRRRTRLFLVTTDRSRGQLPLLISTGPHNCPGRQCRWVGPDPTSSTRFFF